MFLYFRDAAEGFRYMLDGYRNGVITEERLRDAVLRILAFKASLGLRTTPRDELVSGQADFTGTDPSGYLEIAREELEKAGFELLVFTKAKQRAAEGEENVYVHTVMADEANEHYAEKYDAAIVFAKRDGICPGGEHPHHLLDADGRGDSLVRHRGPHRLRVACAAEPPHRRADGQDDDPRARSEPRRDRRGCREDSGSLRVHRRVQ
jgi:hypothetical protein